MICCLPREELVRTGKAFVERRKVGGLRRRGHVCGQLLGPAGECLARYGQHFLMLSVSWCLYDHFLRPLCCHEPKMLQNSKSRAMHSCRA